MAWSKSLTVGMRSSPALAKGVLYVLSSDPANLYAYNGSTGAQLWVFSTNSTARSSPVINEQAVFITVESGYVYGVTFDGNLSWSFVASDLPVSYTGADAVTNAVICTPTLSGDTLLFTASNQFIYQLSVASKCTLLIPMSRQRVGCTKHMYVLFADGVRLWSTSRFNAYSSASVIVDGTVLYSKHVVVWGASHLPHLHSTGGYLSFGPIEKIS